MHKKVIKYGLLLMAILTGVIWYILSVDEISGDMKGQEEVFTYQAGPPDYKEKGTDKSTEENTTSAEALVITVHVCGEVQNPGVIKLSEGLRVVDAIEAVGGFTDFAAKDYLNLARILSDGERIEVPSMEEVLSGEFVIDGDNGTKKAVRVNINTADRDLLMTIPGIGEGKADSILAYRKEHGSFKSIEEIMEVNGIKTALYEKVKDYIKVQN